MKIISLILITRIQKKSPDITLSESCSNRVPNIEKKHSNMGRLQFSERNVACNNKSIYVACD